jgi:HlyD family secretion protein
MRSMIQRSMTWVAVGLVVAVLLAWSFWPRAELVDVAEVTRGSLVVTLDEEGETRVRERFVVSAPVAGHLLRIELDPGDSVVAGETVLAIFQPSDSTPLDPRSRAVAESEVRALEAEVERLKHETERAKAELEFTKRDCQRDRELVAFGVLSKERLEIAELAEKQGVENVDALEHAIEAASHRLSSARARLLNLGSAHRAGDEPLSIRAPIDGVVLRVLRESESVVAAGEPLLEVGDARDLEIVSDYLSRDAVRIRPGSRALIVSWGGEGVLEGRVRRVDPSGFTKVSALGVEEKRVNVIVELVTRYEDREALADGFRVETRIVVAECDNVVRVPAGSLFRRGEGWAVFVIEDGRARLRLVEIGARTPATVEVSSGLVAGERVIPHPGDRISDGVRVAPRAEPNS